MREHPIIEIESVVQPYRRKSSVMLAHKFPEVADEWHYQKNCGFGPDEFCYGSGVRAWWICSFCNREYKAQINSRTGNKTACPYCASKRVCEENALSAVNPVMAAQWHPRKNKDFSPDDLTFSANFKVWWLCEVHPSHEWKASPNNRYAPNGDHTSRCPFCTGQKACVTNSLASLFPKIASEWHPARNKRLTADKVASCSGQRAWWQCKRDKTHVWHTAIDSRTRDETGCPFCSNRRVSNTNSLAAKFPKLAAEWHKTKNGKLTARKIIATSRQIVWWQCRSAPQHEWQTSPQTRVREKTRCPFCLGRRTTTTNNLAVQRPEIASEWHPTRNGKLTPQSLVPGSNVLIWWRCRSNKKHVWAAKLVSRTRNGSGCPYCDLTNRSRPRMTAASGHNLAKLYPELAKQWHNRRNGDLKPSDVTPASNKAVWWKCPRGADHIWRTRVNARTTRKTGCPCCAGRQVADSNCLAIQYPKVAAQWHTSKNGTLSPDQVTSGTEQRIWWQCSRNKRHVWQTTVRNRTIRGQGCPHCRGEVKRT